MTPFLKEIISNKYNRVSEGFIILERGILNVLFLQMNCRKAKRFVIVFLLLLFSTTFPE